MSGSASHLRWRIGTRLQLLTAAVAVAFGVIVVIVSAAYSRVEMLSSEVVDTQVAKVVENSRIGRELSSVFSGINLLSRTFYQRDDLLDSEGAALTRGLEDIAARTDNGDLRRQLARLRDRLNAYLEQCRTLNASTRERARIDASSNRQVDALEQVISRWLINQTLEGRDTYYTDQLLNLTTGYRESLLRISKLYAEQYSAHARARSQSDTGSNALTALVDDLLLRLQTITASSPDIAVHGEELTALVTRYRQVIKRLDIAFIELDARLQALEGTKSSTLGVLALIDQETTGQSARAALEIANIVDRSRQVVIVLSLLVVAATSAFMLVFVRRHIKYPLEAILAGVGELQQGRYDTRLALHRQDEWRTIEQGLNDMGKEISRSWSALKESERRYRLLVENQGDMIVKLDPEGRFQFVSPAYCETFDKTEDELLGQTFIPLVHADDRKQTSRAMASLTTPPHSCRFEQRALSRHGWRWLSWTNRAVLNEAGQVSAIVAVGRDVTERKQAEIALESQHQFLRTVIDAVTDPVLVINRDYEIEMANSAAQREFADDGETLAGSGCATCYRSQSTDVRPCAENPSHSCSLREVLRDGHQVRVIHHRQQNAGAAKRIYEITANPYHDETGRVAGIVQICRDITEQRQAEQRIQFLAHHDALTRLPNRVLAEDRFEQAARLADREDSKVALFFLDLDHFKNINDTLGHHIGDRLLQEVVERLHGQVRESDTISRQGGDEFLIVVPMDSVAVAERIARGILEALSEQVDIEGYALHTSFSIGISVYPDDGRDFSTLMQKADTAMYSAKEAGRNAYRYYADEMNLDALERLQFHSHFRNAFERGELSLAYQPQIELASGRLSGVEALLRWHSPELGVVSPAEFVPLAEETGMIEPIGAWVLEESCRQASEWFRHSGQQVPISVNLSAVQFRRGSLLEQVQKALDLSGLPANMLELELTESILIRDTDSVLAAVCDIKALGVSMAIDDFGTGYSSLSYLKRFPVDRLKIDRSFIMQMAEDSEYAAIVRAIIQMASSLHLEVVAEGVETREQSAWLLHEGCAKAQGYYFGKPVPSSDILASLKNPQDLTG